MNLVEGVVCMASNLIDLWRRNHYLLNKSEPVKERNKSYTIRQIIGLCLGPALFLLLQFVIAPNDMTIEARSVLGITLWIATWWITEPVPIPATSLLPIILLPLTGATDAKTVSEAYGNTTIFLFMGGFMIALAMEKWELHKRVAISILTMVGTNAKMIVLGFMIATGFISMWISNTAAALMMLPIGMAIISQVQSIFSDQNEKNAINFQKSMLLGIAYGASIGGLGTLIGTPPNLIFAGVVREIYGYEISFVRWMLLGVPLASALLIITWYYLTKIAFPIKIKNIEGSQNIIANEKIKLGKMDYEEKMVSLIFVVTAICWVIRPLINKFVPGVDDTSIAIGAGLALFVIPSRNKRGDKLLDWEATKKLPWGILLLFGGGLAIANGFISSGLAKWIIAQLNILAGIELIIILLALSIIVKFLTEVTSNTATATMLLPIMASLALAINVHPFSLMIAATLTAALAFMMPVGTPPNAIVFATNCLRIGDMVKAGLIINVISIFIVVLAVYYIVPVVWGIDLNIFPETFK